MPKQSEQSWEPSTALEMERLKVPGGYLVRSHGSGGRGGMTYLPIPPGDDDSWWVSEADIDPTVQGDEDKDKIADDPAADAEGERKAIDSRNSAFGAAIRHAAPAAKPRPGFGKPPKPVFREEGAFSKARRDQ